MGRLILLVALAATLAVPAVASAGGQPTRTKVPDSAFTGSAPAGVVCAFAASEAPVVNNEYELTYPPAPNGDIVQHESGRVVVRFTNDETGKSIVVNISGPVLIVTHADGSQTFTLEGPTSLINVLPGYNPGVVVVDGRTVDTVSPSGEITVVSFTGTVKLDVCAALA
jgi:hypothetical protein